MGGTYNGGGTLIGPGIPWPVEPAFEPSSKLPALSQSELLRALGYSKADLKPKKKGVILKTLVNDGILLANGTPNIDHPKVRAMVDEKRQRVAGRE